MKYLWLIIIVCTLIGCSAGGRMARILKKHPYLLQVDSISVTDTILIEGFRIDTFVQLTDNTDKLDFVIDGLDISTEIKREIRYIYRNKRVLLDTFKINSKGVRVWVWQDRNQFKFKIEKEDTEKIVTVTVPCPKLVYQLTWWDQFMKNSGLFLWFLIIIGSLIGGTYAKFRKKA